MANLPRKPISQEPVFMPIGGGIRRREELLQNLIKGLGKFKSGLPDLGSNKNYLKGFGRS